LEGVQICKRFCGKIMFFDEQITKFFAQNVGSIESSSKKNKHKKFNNQSFGKFWSEHKMCHN
jgi:hypothetical protein